MVGIVTALCQNFKRQRYQFVLVYNHRQQMEDDKAKVEQICTSNSCSVSFVVADEICLKLRHEKNTVVLIDEVDAVLLDKALIFSRDCSKSVPLKVIGLTATTPSEFLAYELSYLEGLGFTIYDSKIKATFDS